MRSVGVVFVAVVSLLVAACGDGASKPAASPMTSAPPLSAGSPALASPQRPAAAPKHDVTAEQFCARVAWLAPTCPPLATLNQDLAGCPSLIQRELDASHDTMLPIMRCVVDNNECAAAMKCIIAATPDPTSQLRACDASASPGLSAVGVPKTAWAQRNGAGVTKFRDAHSTQARPIEMCGIDAANEWLTHLRCDDGSQAVKSHHDAELTRTGNLGPGGRCGSLIDDYDVTCPERRYEIFMDAYICPLDP
ncbi:MAG TPA: hypothetical protein VH165_30825 [Kofleriaceae bacterium]|jgi:hypothetical protein|nr:hypothetical protein [Kofleriaceae bacterium]